MGHIYKGIPKKIVLDFLRTENIGCFVETGTHIGSTAFWAAGNFKKVYTIEIMEELSKQVSQRPDCPKNINFYAGSSLEVLPRIVKELDSNSIFWLDGHYSGPGTGGNENECPVMDEIKIISACKDALVLIDDARCFYGPPPKPHNAAHWPGISTVLEQLTKYFPGHYITIVDDVIFCVPARLKKILDDDWYSNYDERFAAAPVQQGEGTVMGKLKAAIFGSKN